MRVTLKSDENGIVKNYTEGKFRENYLLFQVAFLSHNFSIEFHAFLRENG